MDDIDARLRALAKAHDVDLLELIVEFRENQPGKCWVHIRKRRTEGRFISVDIGDGFLSALRAALDEAEGE